MRSSLSRSARRGRKSCVSSRDCLGIWRMIIDGASTSEVRD